MTRQRPTGHLFNWGAFPTFAAAFAVAVVLFAGLVLLFDAVAAIIWKLATT